MRCLSVFLWFYTSPNVGINAKLGREDSDVALGAIERLLRRRRIYGGDDDAKVMLIILASPNVNGLAHSFANFIQQHFSIGYRAFKQS